RKRGGASHFIRARLGRSLASMRTALRLSRVAAFAVLFLGVASAMHLSAVQAPADALPSAKLVAPEPDAFATGVLMLRASVDEAASIENVTFFVDGRQVCIVSQRPFECEWDAGSDVKAHQFRAVFNLPERGRVARSVPTNGLTFVDKVNVEVVQVTVTVTDDSGHFVGGIPRSAFKILEDGKPQTVTYFASEDVPLELIVAVDISGSMGPSMPKLKRAVKGFLGAIPSNDAVTLLGFNDNV